MSENSVLKSVVNNPVAFIYEEVLSNTIKVDRNYLFVGLYLKNAYQLNDALIASNCSAQYSRDNKKVAAFLRLEFPNSSVAKKVAGSKIFKNNPKLAVLGSLSEKKSANGSYKVIINVDFGAFIALNTIGNGEVTTFDNIPADSIDSNAGFQKHNVERDLDSSDISNIDVEDEVPVKPKEKKKSLFGHKDKKTSSNSTKKSLFNKKKKENKVEDVEDLEEVEDEPDYDVSYESVKQATNKSDQLNAEQEILNYSDDEFKNFIRTTPTPLLDKYNSVILQRFRTLSMTPEELSDYSISFPDLIQAKPTMQHQEKPTVKKAQSTEANTFDLDGINLDNLD